MKLSLLISAPFVRYWLILYFLVVCFIHYGTEGYCLRRELAREFVITRDVESIVTAVDLCKFENDCEIRCLPDGYSHTIYHESIQSVYDDHPECHLNGTKLTLPKDATPSKMELNWLKVDINITELVVDFLTVYQFSEGVFQSNMFANMKTLKIDNLQPCELRKGTFVGLQSLENLIMTNVNFNEINPYQSDQLESLSGTLRTFHLTEFQPRKKIYIENFIGGNTILSHLEYISIKSNLSSIGIISLTAIPFVKELDLSDCFISVIGEDSFKNIGSNLQILNLERNRLMTLPTGIFSTILDNLHFVQEMEDESLQNVSIKLSGNPWHCDCSLENVKGLLGNYSIFNGDVRCSTPEIIENYPIKDTEFCPIPIPTTEATTISSTESTSIPEITTPKCITDCDDFIEKECSSYQNFGLKNKIQIQPRIQSIQLSVKSGDVAIELQNNSPNMVLIWFASVKLENDLPVYFQSDILDCVTDLPKEINISNLDEGATYTFCLMHRGATTVSPFDCISYYHDYHQADSEHNRIWLHESSKPLVISGVVIGFVTSIVIGVMIGLIFLRYETVGGQRVLYSFRMAFNCSKTDSTTIRGAVNQNFVDDFNRRQMNNQANGERRYISGFESKNINNKIISTFDDDNPPPLPPHPNRLSMGEEDDNYYSTVRFFSK